MENVIEFKYNRTPLYGHSRNTDTWLSRTVSLSLGKAVTSPLNSTRLIGTDTPLIRTCFQRSALTGFVCILACLELKRQIRPYTPIALENHTRSRFQTKMGKLYTRSRPKRGKTDTPFGAAHVFMAFTRGYPPGS